VAPMMMSPHPARGTFAVIRHRLIGEAPRPRVVDPGGTGRWEDDAVTDFAVADPPRRQQPRERGLLDDHPIIVYENNKSVKILLGSILWRVSASEGQLRGTRARDAIVDAARRQFLEVGFRRASIESISAAAGVSRPTVYAHFASKQEVFRTIVAQLHDERIRAMADAAVPDAPIADQLYAVLSARFAPFVALTASSPYGAELLDENSRTCGDITRDSRQRSTRLLRELLANADRAGTINLGDVGLTPATAADVIYDAARGAKEDATLTVQAYRRQLSRLVTVLARGLGAGR
jgi:AcrR family transcriptional regulator